MSVDGYLTAKREYCAACGGLLGSGRYLVQSIVTKKYVAIHHSAHCMELFLEANRPEPQADTSNHARPIP